MYRFFSAYPMLRILLPLVAGIMLTDKGLITPFTAACTLLVCLVVQIPGFIWLRSTWYYRLRFPMGFSLQLAVLSIGSLLYCGSIPEYNHHHIGRETVLEDQEQMVEVDSYLGPAGSFERYIVKLGPKHSTQAYLYLKPDKLGIRPVPGATLSINSEVSPIPPPNANDFDFRQYAYHQGISHQSFCRRNEWSLEARGKSTWEVIPSKIQFLLASNIRRFVENESAQAVLTALVCGDKRLIDDHLRDTFSKTGSMHVLAVSGLHVGILFLILSKIWASLIGSGYRSKSRFCFLLVGIWMYAAVTGFSPSVSRATLMFSFILLSQVLDRPAQVNNSILAAAVILLCINPHNLFQLGFQLSFSAVWGIVNLQPLFMRILSFDNQFLHSVWELTTVSIAAQLATMPLTISSFGSFPCVFLLANYIVIPLAGILLFGGLFLSVISWIPILPELTGKALGLLVGLEYHLLDSLSKFPVSVLQPDWPGLLGIMAFYGLLWVWSKFDDLNFNQLARLVLFTSAIWQLSFIIQDYASVPG
jgi:competence protein ComEC